MEIIEIIFFIVFVLLFAVGWIKFSIFKKVILGMGLLYLFVLIIEMVIYDNKGYTFISGHEKAFAAI